MANIINYIKTYGSKTFDEVPYNEIDNVILSVLSYNDFYNIVKVKKEKIRLQEALDIFLKTTYKKYIKKSVMGVIMASKILMHLSNTKRYKDLLLYNYVVKRNNDTQFSAIFIDINESLTYISFEGTDDLISGWKEDFELSYKFPNKSQLEAIKYINKNINFFSKRKYILGGHSKGGNLALVAGMYANPFIKNKIIKIISNDGPGLIESQIKSNFYKKIESKYELIIPAYSVVGLLLRHKDDMIIVSSSSRSFLCHNVLSWQVDDVTFKRTKLSQFSKATDKIITKWLDNYDYKKRKQFTEDLFMVFKRVGIYSIKDLKNNIPILIKIVKESKNIDSNTKAMIKDFIYFTFKNYKDYYLLKNDE